MDRYLFRGKRVDNREWVEGYYVKDPQGNSKIYWQPFKESSSNTYHKVIPETLGQCTGKEDKHGNLVYEGDKVDDHFVGIGIILWGEFGWKISYQNSTVGKHFGDFLDSEWAAIEIIGNAHDQKGGE